MKKKRGTRKTTRTKKASRRVPLSRRANQSLGREKWVSEETVLPAKPVRTPSDLPFSYGETKLVLMVRDPYWAFSYWDFSGETWNGAEKRLAADSSLKPMIRVHDLDAKRRYDLLVSLEARNWYLHLGTPDRRYLAELGLGDGRARFFLIARSNEVKTPRDSPSQVIDPEWNDRDFEEIYRLSGGGDTGLSSLSSIFISRQAQ